MDAIIMCAGLGTRLRPLTDNCPKPLVPIAGKGSLERTLEILPAEVTRVILVVGYLADHIRTRIGSESFGRPVTYVTQDVLDGSGGALRVARTHVADLSDRFLVINGDDLYAKEDLAKLVQEPLGILALETLAPRTIDSCVVQDGKLMGLSQVPQGETGLINIGAYLLDQRWFETAPTLTPGKTTEWSLPHGILQLLEKEISVSVVLATFWMPVGTPEELAAAEKVLSA